MGAFFFALIGLLCVAGGKSVDNVSKKLDEKNAANTQNRINTEYKKLRIDYRTNSKELESEFRKMPIGEIASLLSDDLYFITGERQSEDYFVKALACENPCVIRGLILLWLSKNGVIPRDFATYADYYSHLGSFSVYFDELHKPVSTSIFDNGCDNKELIETKNKALSLRTLKRIEYNLRKIYPNLRFVFLSKTDSRNKKKITDIFRLDFQLMHEITYTENRIFGWDSSETCSEKDVTMKEAQTDWNDMPATEKIQHILKAALYCMCIIALGAAMYACNPS